MVKTFLHDGTWLKRFCMTVWPYTYIQQIFMMRHSPKAQGAYNEEQNCEENVQIYNIMEK